MYILENREYNYSTLSFHYDIWMGVYVYLTTLYPLPILILLICRLYMLTHLQAFLHPEYWTCLVLLQLPLYPTGEFQFFVTRQLFHTDPQVTDLVINIVCHICLERLKV